MSLRHTSDTSDIGAGSQSVYGSFALCTSGLGEPCCTSIVKRLYNTETPSFSMSDGLLALLAMKTLSA